MTVLGLNSIEARARRKTKRRRALKEQKAVPPRVPRNVNLSLNVIIFFSRPPRHVLSLPKTTPAVALVYKPLPTRRLGLAMPVVRVGPPKCPREGLVRRPLDGRGVPAPPAVTGLGRAEVTTARPTPVPAASWERPDVAPVRTAGGRPAPDADGTDLALTAVSPAVTSRPRPTRLPDVLASSQVVAVATPAAGLVTTLRPRAGPDVPSAHIEILVVAATDLAGVFLATDGHVMVAGQLADGAGVPGRAATWIPTCVEETPPGATPLAPVALGRVEDGPATARLDVGLAKRPRPFPPVAAAVVVRRVGTPLGLAPYTPHVGRPGREVASRPGDGRGGPLARDGQGLAPVGLATETFDGLPQKSSNYLFCVLRHNMTRTVLPP